MGTLDNSSTLDAPAAPAWKHPQHVQSREVDVAKPLDVVNGTQRRKPCGLDTRRRHRRAGARRRQRTPATPTRGRRESRCRGHRGRREP